MNITRILQRNPAVGENLQLTAEQILSDPRRIVRDLCMSTQNKKRNEKNPYQSTAKRSRFSFKEVEESPPSDIFMSLQCIKVW